MAAAAMAEMKEEGAEEFCLPEIELPVDSEGFTQSFDAHSIFGRENSSDETTLTSLSTFFAAYGFVVMRGVFSAEECEATRSAMWDILEAQVNSGVNSDSKKAAITTKKNKKKKALTEPPPPLPPTPSPLPPLPPSPHLINGSFDRAYPSTWHHLKPTGKYGLSTRGPTFEPLLVRNRQNPLLAKALAHIIEAESTEDVMVSHDRFTIYRATVFDDPSIEGKQFGTGRKNVHLDLNPWWWEEDSNDIISGVNTLQYEETSDFIRENNMVASSMGRHVQCVLNFADNREEDGGTLVVPMFHRHLHAFNRLYMPLRKPIPWSLFSLACEEALLSYAQRVTMREGSVLIWNQTLAHGSCPNASKNCRMAQFMKAFSRSATFPGKGSTKGSATSSVIDRLSVTDEGLSLPLSDEGDSLSVNPRSRQEQEQDNNKIEEEDIEAENIAAAAAVAASREQRVQRELSSQSRLLRRSKALHREMTRSGAIEIVSPLGQFLFGLDVLD